jgi:hypothetical protein
MKKILIKNPDFRKIIYAALIFLSVFSVFVRISLVKRERSAMIVSFVSEWNKHGKPVTVEKIKVADIPVYAKFTVINKSDKLANGFVTGDIKDKLRQGQEVYPTDKGMPFGRITSISQELDTDTGMFPVEVKFNAAAARLGLIRVVFAHTQTIQEAIVVPNSILDFYEGNYYLWKIENGKSKKIQVKIGLRNGYGTIVSAGVNADDLIVINGRSILSENDLVRIVSESRAL